MRVNKYVPHLLVLPEDEADLRIANGFLLHPQLNDRSIQVLSPAGGWRVVVDKFKKNHAPKMRQYPNRLIVLLIDFDGEDDRYETIIQDIPDDLKDRVFILGALNEPEDLRKSLGKNFEAIGEELATNCANQTYELWGHEFLNHNKCELERMASSISFLFNR